MVRGRVLAGLAAVLAGGAAWATPLKMTYCVTPVGGIYEYEFELVLDNNDGTWAPGQKFGQFIFGDTMLGPTALPGFVMDPASYPVGPFTQLGTTLGFHNGPTLEPIVLSQPGSPANLWGPTAIGQKLTWRGTSAANLGQGQMKWSNLMYEGGATFAEFVVANLVDCSDCYPDCNQSGNLTIADFACFQSAFASGNMYADCNTSGTLTIADFACFQSQFAAGCP